MTLASCIFPIKDGRPLKSLRSVRPMLLRLQPFDAERNGLFDSPSPAPSRDAGDTEMESSVMVYRVNMKLPDEDCASCDHCGNKIKSGSSQIEYQHSEPGEIVYLHGSCASTYALVNGHALNMMWAIDKHLPLIPGSSLEDLLRLVKDQITEGLTVDSGSETTLSRGSPHNDARQ